MEARPSEKGVPNTHSTKYLPLRKSYLMWPWCVMITKEMLHADTFPQIAFLDVKIEMILGKCFDDGGLWKSKKETRNMLKNWRWPVSQLELLWHQGQGGSWSQSCPRQWKLLCNNFIKLDNFTLNNLHCSSDTKLLRLPDQTTPLLSDLSNLLPIHSHHLKYCFRKFCFERP